MRGIDFQLDIFWSLQIEAVCAQAGVKNVVETSRKIHGGVIFDTHASPEVNTPFSPIVVTSNDRVTSEMITSDNIRKYDNIDQYVIMS